MNRFCFPLYDSMYYYSFSFTSLPSLCILYFKVIIYSCHQSAYSSHYQGEHQLELASWQVALKFTSEVCFLQNWCILTCLGFRIFYKGSLTWLCCLLHYFSKLNQWWFTLLMHIYLIFINIWYISPYLITFLEYTIVCVGTGLMPCVITISFHKTCNMYNQHVISMPTHWQEISLLIFPLLADENLDTCSLPQINWLQLA